MERSLEEDDLLLEIRDEVAARVPAQLPEHRAGIAGRHDNAARADPRSRRRAEDRVEPGGPAGVRFLLQRESGRQPSALEPGDRAADRRPFGSAEIAC